MAKMKISTIAEDFNLSSKDIISIFKEKEISKSSSSAVSDEEFGVFINLLTTKNQVTNIQDYLEKKATIGEPKKVEPKVEPKPEAKVEPKKENTVEPKQEVKAPVQNNEPRYTVPKQNKQPMGQNAPANRQNPQQMQNRGNNQGNSSFGQRNNGQNNSSFGQRNNNQNNNNRNNFGQRNNNFQNQKRGIDKSDLARKMEEFRREQSGRTIPLYNKGEEPKETEVKNTIQTPVQAPVQTPAAAHQAAQEAKKGQAETQKQPQQKKEVKQIKKKEPVDRFSRFENKPGQAPQKQEKKKQEKKDDRSNRILISGGSKQEESSIVITRDESKQSSVRIVDTHTTQIDLSKYDDSLDSRYSGSQNDNQISRQKLKKKNENANQGKAAKDKEKAAQERMKRMQAELARKKQLEITVPDSISVGELATRMKKTSAEVVKKLMMLGMMVSINDEIDFDTAYLVCEEFNIKVTKEVVVTIEEKLFENIEDSQENLIERDPVVCVMGHVDHGKTSILDAIRHTNVTKGEAGGITQHIGAYRVKINGKDITFLDTPGHEAFTAMRMRGAQATDIAILVVAADDGIMPQTVEAINHAKAAGVDIIVAINKMDKPQANPDQIKQQLTQYELVPEEWGGDVICVPVSALTGKGIDDLLESVLLIAEVKQLKANPNRRAKGLVIESRLDKGRGPVATILVQNGTLHTGDVVIAGTSVGRVRAMVNENGTQLKEAGPSVPVEIIGLSEVPNSGDEFNAVEDEKMARSLAEQRREKAKQEEFKATARMNLDTLFSQISEGVQTLNVVVKADVGGSAEAVKQSLVKLSNDEVKVSVIHSAVGGITESDVMLAASSNAIIVGFNVRPDRMALDSAERQGVEIRTYRIIYDIIDEITAAMKGMLAPKFKETLLGHAEVRQTIHVPSVGTIAGCYVLDGKIARHAKIRIVRDGIVIYEDEISSLKRFKDDAKEVAAGYECGVGLEAFNDIKIGDSFEAFIMEEVKE